MGNIRAAVLMLSTAAWMDVVLYIVVAVGGWVMYVLLY